MSSVVWRKKLATVIVGHFFQEKRRLKNTVDNLQQQNSKDEVMKGVQQNTAIDYLFLGENYLCKKPRHNRNTTHCLL